MVVGSDRLGVSRRRFVQGTGVAGLGLLAGCGRLPWQSEAPAAKVPRVGFISIGSNPDASDGASTVPEDLRRGLREIGYSDGRNVVVEWRYADGQPDRLNELAAELVRLPVDVLVAWATALPAAGAATSTIPIVGLSADPVRAGLAASYARPGGNVTGIANMQVQLNAKRLELLRDATPGLARVGVLWTPYLPGRGRDYDELRESAATLGLELQSLAVNVAGDLDSAIGTAGAAGARGLLTIDNFLLTPNAGHIAELAKQHQLTSIAVTRPYPAAGVLMSYGANAAAIGRRVAEYVDKILNGAKPADLPVEQPTTFDFVINLKSAQALGLTIPQHVLLQATEIIQ
ncbi:MAG TPA: ABC transporter substrate-binding protein [Chloroflexota bacterium]|jgi:putative ABC transport system substrate-binding protein